VPQVHLAPPRVYRPPPGRGHHPSSQLYVFTLIHSLIAFVQPRVVPICPCPEHVLLKSVLWLFLRSTYQSVSTSFSQNTLLLPGSLIDIVKAPYPDPISPELIMNKVVSPIGPINGSFAPVKEGSTLDERIPWRISICQEVEMVGRESDRTARRDHNSDS